MVRKKIIQQLLEWIECNLEHPISIEDVAQKSGYSRRNIQLLFSSIVHMPLGTYIRKRRLCRAAILVRLTAKSMLDIALSLHFDSQQSFSREFKKMFGCSPREYRHRDFWDLEYILPPLLSRNDERPKCKLIHIPETCFYGESFKYDVEIKNTPSEEEVKIRRNQLAKDLKKYKQDIYYITSFKPSTKSVGLLTVETFAGSKDKDSDVDILKELRITEGLYASFHYEGRWEDYASWVHSLYLKVLPAEGLVRVNGCDIERFNHNTCGLENENNNIACDIFIPVRPKIN
ncbi:helix-turn-helix domain-containing protein [Salmonella enterica]